jgi:YidC/Oxa1 family membrane protein insertase
MPQLQEIRKRYKNDKQRLNEETMKFYKENGINPLGGCLPLVAQLPVFWALFNVLRAIADWQPGQVPKYGLTVPVVESAREARIFGASLADKFLFPLPHQTLESRLVILAFVLVSAATTYLTMRQSQKRGMMQQGPVDPDNPAANMQKYMMYIAPFFALSGLYWQFGLVIYWVTTNVWTLGQQHVLFRNLPIVGSATVDASAAPANALTSGKASANGKAVTAGKSGGSGKSGASGKSGTSGRATGSAKPATQNGGASTANGDTAAGSVRGLLKFGKNKPEPEPEPSAPQAKVVRQQPVRQTRSKRSGNSGKR